MADLRGPLMLACALLAGCSAGNDPVQDEPAATEDSLISCAIGSASQLTRNCAVERSMDEGALTLTIRHEDGGFRRLLVMTDGSGVVAADGADEAQITVFDGEIEVALGSDTYLLPATIVGEDAE